MVARGQGTALYDFEAQARMQREVLGGRPLPTGLLAYLNPPHVALALAPLAPLSLRQTLVIWRLAQGLLLVLLLRLLARERPAFEAWLAGSAALAAPPMILTFELGAFSLLMLALLLKARDALAAGRERSAGLWLALGAVKPQLMLMPALAPLVGRRWRVAGALAAGLAVLVVASSLALGWRIWPDYARALLVVHEGFERIGIHPEAMYNLKGVLLLALGRAARETAPAVGLAGWIVGTLLTVWIWRGPWPGREPRLDLQLAATLVVGSFFSLHFYTQDGLIIVGAALLFDSYLRRAGRPRVVFAGLALTAPAIWFLMEVITPPTVLRFGVVLEVALGALMAQELYLVRRASPAETGEAPGKLGPSRARAKRGQPTSGN
jgi:hypothetical protein